jgi:CarboxypepD_reg-like domain
MKIKSTLIILLLLLFQNSFSQTIRDSIFNDVILIKNENPNINDETFFKNIYIKTQNKPIVIFNGLRNIPAQKFFESKSFLSEQNEIILINNDDELDALIRRREKTENIHIKAKGQKIYHIIRNGSEIIVDSLTKNIYDFRKPIKINFKKTEIKTKKIRGFILDNSQYTKTKVPIVGANIEIKGTERKTLTDEDGKFEIEVNEGEKLVISGFRIKRKIEILVTTKDCYKVDLDTVIFEESWIDSPQEYLEQQREIEQKMLRKIKEGFYDCKDE